MGRIVRLTLPWENHSDVTRTLLELPDEGPRRAGLSFRLSTSSVGDTFEKVEGDISIGVW